MALRVIWTVVAQNDREKIFRFWNERTQSNEYSRKLNKEINDKIHILKAFPESG